MSDKPEQFARALKTFYFQTALTSTSEDNIKRRAILKTSASIWVTSHGKNRNIFLLLSVTAEYRNHFFKFHVHTLWEKQTNNTTTPRIK